MIETIKTFIEQNLFEKMNGFNGSDLLTIFIAIFAAYIIQNRINAKKIK